MRLSGRGRRGGDRRKPTVEEARHHDEHQTSLKEAVARLAKAKQACEKKTRGRLGPPLQIVSIQGSRVQLKVPHSTKPLDLHVMAVEPVLPAQHVI